MKGCGDYLRFMGIDGMINTFCGHLVEGEIVLCDKCKEKEKQKPKRKWGRTYGEVELKTLRDIKVHPYLVNINDLKEEAIKWAKFHKNYPNEKRDAICDWIIIFFNFTEEDLK